MHQSPLTLSTSPMRYAARSAALLAGAGLAVIALSALPASAATVATPALPAIAGGTITGPFPVPEPPVQYPAGGVCPFPIRIAAVVNQTQVIRDTAASGRVVAEFYYGRLLATATNLTTGRSEPLDLSGSGLFRYSADGTTTIHGVGPYGLALRPGDHPGPLYAVPNGYSRVVISPTGTKTVVYASELRNVCSDLAR